MLKTYDEIYAENGFGVSKDGCADGHSLLGEVDEQQQ